MNTLWQEMFDKTTGFAQGFAMRGEVIYRRCVLCDALFSQTEEGWVKLKEHEFEVHEAPTSYDYRELHGKKVTIGVVDREDEDGKLIRELIARDDDGVVYFLPFSYYDADEKEGFKCKPKSQGSNLKNLMLQGQVSQ